MNSILNNRDATWAEIYHMSRDYEAHLRKQIPHWRPDSEVSESQSPTVCGDFVIEQETDESSDDFFWDCGECN